MQEGERFLSSAPPDEGHGDWDGEGRMGKSGHLKKGVGDEDVDVDEDEDEDGKEVLLSLVLTFINRNRI